MATRKQKIRAWLIKRQKIIEELSQRLGVVRDCSDERWLVFRSDGNWYPVKDEDVLSPDFRRLVAERNYYLGALDLCSACGIEY